LTADPAAADVAVQAQFDTRHSGDDRAMDRPRFHLAQANIARMIEPLDHPSMSGFVEQLDYINAVADRSEGFVWRLQTEEGDATAIRAFEDERILFNMSVWESIEALQKYVYRSDHRGPLRDRRQWFERMDGPHLVLWWIPAGHLPSIDEARTRFDLLRDRGPSSEAFTFQQSYSPTGALIARPRREGWASCGT
jgi:hypothetical protein